MASVSSLRVVLRATQPFKSSGPASPPPSRLYATAPPLRQSGAAGNRRSPSHNFYVTHFLASLPVFGASLSFQPRFYGAPPEVAYFPGHIRDAVKKRPAIPFLLYDESDSDAEEEQTTKRRRPTLGVQLDDKRKEMLKSHPLSVMLDLKCRDESVLHLTFYYLLNLNIMTVKARVTTATELITPISAGDLLSPDSVLSCLYPGDHGKKTPNPANQYQFDKVGILTLRDYVLDLGHPYLWVQKLGGLHFPKEQPQPTVTADHSLSASHMETTMKLLKTRVQSRLALHKQFASLEHGIVPVTSDCHNLFPAKVVSRLVKWVTMTPEDYMELHFTREIVEAGLAEDTSLYYMALIERGTAKLQAAVVLNPGYSSIPPIFQLCLNWKGEKTNSNDDNIRAMESEVNVCYKELYGAQTSYQLLTNQLQRLCVLLDVYLETESHDDSVEGPKEFPQEKMCLRLFRGPSRMKPFKYNHPQGFFSHR
ncbi:PREDICTED: THO complex subunit 5 homolog [Elephantulus edwardii]|uniref:THO complex subunit 5 homolog n=1 Tax=Elephantulus edwardii TaxID=28737 RepID=UPI0003F06C5E|nr:PREDICTED: THO complex subunit 5 homolog [Elephantulus edwardii]